MNNFSIHKGENKKEKIKVYKIVDGEKQEYQLGVGESYVFEMREKCCSPQALLTKTFVDNEVEFVNNDTKNLACGKYPYMVKLVLPNGEFIVVIKNEVVIE